MGIKEFDIVYGHGSAVYYAGSTITGQVVLEMDEPLKFNEMRLQFKGQANVHWTEQRSNGKSSYTVHFTSKENYFKIIVPVVVTSATQTQGSGLQLAAGRHFFPFQYTLDDHLPSSFEGECGVVRYSVQCEIDISWRPNKKVRRCFTVLSMLDLNMRSDSLEPAEVDNEKNLCCLCCKSGPIEAHIHVNRRGYVPGEAIQLFADIRNGSGRRMTKSFFSLLLVADFHATSKSRTSEKTIVEITRPGIPAHKEDSWNGDEIITIPPLPPSFLTGCSIIDIRYVLRLNVDPAGPAFDLKVPLDIIIGTVPLMSVVQDRPPMAPGPPPTLPWVTSVPPDFVIYPSPPDTGIPQLPSPAYGVSATGHSSCNHGNDKQDTPFVPLYPYYNWGHTFDALLPEKEKRKKTNKVAAM